MNKNQRGISIYLSLMVMTVILAIALGTSAILVSQLKTIKGLGDSVAAFYAADTAIERVIYAMQKENYMPFPGEEPCGSVFSCPPLPNGAYYKIKVTQVGEANIIDVKGIYKSVNRSLRISFVPPDTSSAFSFIGSHPGAENQPTVRGKILYSAVSYADSAGNEKIYWGYGDYGANTGPIDLMPFDVKTLKFLPSEYTAQTEAIYTFRVLPDKKLYFPHIDQGAGEPNHFIQ